MLFLYSPCRILRLREAGLVDYWKKTYMSLMVDHCKLEPPGATALKLQDFYKLFYFTIAVPLSISILVFFGELMVHKIGNSTQETLTWSKIFNVLHLYPSSWLNSRTKA